MYTRWPPYAADLTGTSALQGSKPSGYTLNRQRRRLSAFATLGRRRSRPPPGGRRRTRTGPGPGATRVVYMHGAHAHRAGPDCATATSRMPSGTYLPSQPSAAHQITTKHTAPQCHLQTYETTTVRGLTPTRTPAGPQTSDACPYARHTAPTTDLPRRTLSRDSSRRRSSTAAGRENRPQTCR